MRKEIYILSKVLIIFFCNRGIASSVADVRDIVSGFCLNSSRER